MTDPIVNCVHPSPVRFVPKGGHRVRDGYRRLTTTVRLRTAAKDGFRMLPSGAGDEWKPRDGFGYRPPPLFLAEHEGSLWRVLNNATPGHHRDVPLDEFVQWLDGTANIWELRAPLSGTPLHAAVDYFCKGGRPAYREMFELAKGQVNLQAKEVLLDDEDRARAAFSAYVESDIIAAGQRVYIRYAPLCEASHQHDAEFHIGGGLVHFASPLVMMEQRSVWAVPFRPDRADELDPRWHPPVQADVHERICARFAPYHLADADLSMMANWLPVRTRAALLRLADEHVEARELAEDLAAHAVRGREGLVLPEEHEAALVVSLEGLRLVSHLAPAGQDWYAGNVADYVERALVPRVRALYAEPEAEEVIAGLRF